MKALLDTNVIVSGIFFGGTPGRILSAWRSGSFILVASPLILEEYRRVALEFARGLSSFDVANILDLITIHAEVVGDHPLGASVCRDPHDDKFLACGSVAGATLVSGDKDLLAVDGAMGVSVLSPRAFLTKLAR